MNQTSIQAINITKTIGPRLLFDSISFTLSHGEKAGLVGLNGCGKSTLLRILKGRESFDSGAVKVIPKGAKVGFLPQEITYGQMSLGEILENALPREVDSHWEKESRINAVLCQVGLSGRQLDFSAEKMSGGEKTRTALAALLLEEPDFLLLDEPTNFMDIKGLSWLEEMLMELPCGILVVSHDRFFLDRLCGRILEIDDTKLYLYSGNYSFYRDAREERIERQWKDYKSQNAEIKRLKALAAEERQVAGRIENQTVNDFVRRRNKKHTKRAKALEKRIEHMEIVEKPKKNYLAGISFNGAATSRVVASAEGMGKEFPGRILYQGVGFSILAGEKVGIVGENGSGKTTLLNILMGDEPPTKGKTFLLSKERVASFSGIFDKMGHEIPAVEFLMKQSGMNLWESRQHMAGFLFFREDVFKKIGELSPGEKSRLALSVVKAKEPEVLILDEPTNHLDVDTTQILEEALMDFPGAVIIVTHDRFLLDRLTTRILAVEDGAVGDYPGNYSYYVEKKSRPPSCDDRLLLECRLSHISAKLGRDDVSPDEKEALAREFEEIRSALK